MPRIEMKLQQMQNTNQHKAIPLGRVFPKIVKRQLHPSRKVPVKAEALREVIRTVPHYKKFHHKVNWDMNNGI